MAYTSNHQTNVSALVISLQLNTIQKRALDSLAREDHQEKVYVPTKFMRGMFR